MRATVLDREVTLEDVLHLLTEELGPGYVVSRTGTGTALSVRKRHGVRCATITADCFEGRTTFTVTGRGLSHRVREALERCLSPTDATVVANSG